MHPDLVGAPCMKSYLKQAEVICDSQTLNIGMGRFAISIGTAQYNAVRSPGNGPVYGQAPGGKSSFGYGQIIPVIVQMLPAESILYLGLFCNQAQSGGITVQAVHRMIRTILPCLLIVPGQCVCQRSIMSP